MKQGGKETSMSKVNLIPSRCISVPTIREKKLTKEKIVMVTAYDYPTAKICDEAMVDIILVGDSLGMVVQGREDTLSVTLSQMIYHTEMVSRATKRALVVSDMPFLTYHTSIKEAIRNCGLCIKEGGAQAVKIEGSGKRAKLIKILVENEIPVMGHIGLTPQSIHKLGGFKVQGKDEFSKNRLIEEAKQLEEADVFAIVLECIPYEVSKEITNSVKVPTIGIGSGIFCDGQVLVFHDLLGISEGPYPKFVKKYKNLRNEIFEGVSEFAREVREGLFPLQTHSYSLNKEEKSK